MSIKDKIKETIKFIGNRSPQYKDGVALLNVIVDSLYIDNMSDDEVMTLFTTTALRSVIHMDPNISNGVYSIMASSFNRIHYIIHGHEESLEEISYWSDKKISEMTNGIDAERRSEIKNHIKSLQQDDPYRMKPVNIDMLIAHELVPTDRDPNSGIMSVINKVNLNPGKIPTPFGKKLRKLRVEHNESMKTMATRLHVSPAYLSKVELGDSNPPVRWLNEVAVNYALSHDEKDDLKRAMHESYLTITVSMREWSNEDRELFKLFVSTFGNLSDNEKDQILQILNNSKK